MPVNNVVKSDVGTVVQDFIDNDETVVVARKVAENNYTVGPADSQSGASRGRPMGVRATTKKTTRASTKRKPRRRSS